MSCAIGAEDTIVADERRQLISAIEYVIPVKPMPSVIIVELLLVSVKRSCRGHAHRPTPSFVPVTRPPGFHDASSSPFRRSNANRSTKSSSVGRAAVARPNFFTLPLRQPPHCVAAAQICFPSSPLPMAPSNPGLCFWEGPSWASLPDTHVGQRCCTTP